MICETCKGTGFYPTVQSTEDSGEFFTCQPCSECNGQMIAHCCEGLREQPETD